MSEFFNDLADVELGVKDGKYPAYIRKSEIVTKKDGTKAWAITYRIADGAQKGEDVQEWHNSYTDPDKQTNAKKWRARRLESLGVPKSQWTTFDPATVVGTPVIIGVKNSGSFTNVNSAVLANDTTEPWTPLNNGSTDTPSPTASAPAAPPVQATAADITSQL